MNPDALDRGVTPVACRRFYRIGGLVLRLTANRDLRDSTFHPKFDAFRVAPTLACDISIHHHLGSAGPAVERLETPFGRGRHWTVYRDRRFWVYARAGGSGGEGARVAIFNDSHTRGRIYQADAARFQAGRLTSLSMMDSDQVVLARVLADRGGCLVHAAGLLRHGRGFLFLGHSGAGKSTLMSMLRDEGEVLCDDRIIVRRGDDGLRLYGTWSHGTLPITSPATAPLHAAFVLEKSSRNEAVRMGDPRELARLLPVFLIKPALTPDWWEKVMLLLEDVIRTIPVYRLRFDRSGAIREIIRNFQI